MMSLPEGTVLHVLNPPSPTVMLLLLLCGTRYYTRGDTAQQRLRTMKGPAATGPELATH